MFKKSYKIIAGVVGSVGLFIWVYLTGKANQRTLDALQDAREEAQIKTDTLNALKNKEEREDELNEIPIDRSSNRIKRWLRPKK